MWNLKYDTNELICETETDLQIKNRHVVDNREESQAREGLRSSGLTDANWYSWEEGMAAHSSILAWRIPWTEEPGRLRTIGLQRVGHD